MTDVCELVRFTASGRVLLLAGRLGRAVLLPRKSTLADVGSWTNRFPEYAAAVAFLGRKDLRELPCGTYRLDGERTVAQIREEELVPLSEEAAVHVYPDHDTIYAKLTSGHYMFTTGPDNDYQHFGGDGVFCVPAGLAHTCARTHGRPRKTRVCVISVGSSVDGPKFRRASVGTGRK